jgi:Tfp pilus assembly major pilin PilA
MKDKKNTLIRSTIDGTTVEECPTLKSLNTKVWQALRNAGMTACETAEKFRLIGNFSGGLAVTQSDGFWKAAEKRNASSSSGKKAILTNEQYLNKYFALKGMVAANDPKLQPLIKAIEAELAAHDAAAKEQQDREDKAKSRELVKWFSGLPLTTQEQIKASATAVAANTQEQQA